MAQYRFTRWYGLRSSHCRQKPNLTYSLDLPGDRLGRPAYKVSGPRRRYFRRSLRAPKACRTPPTYPNHIQRLRIRRPTVEVRSSTTRSPSSPRRDRSRFLHRDQQIVRRYHWRSYIFCHTRTGRSILQQDPMFLLRRAEIKCWGNGGHARLLLHRSRIHKGY